LHEKIARQEEMGVNLMTALEEAKNSAVPESVPASQESKRRRIKAKRPVT
jgi:hypothetical protein